MPPLRAGTLFILFSNTISLVAQGLQLFATSDSCLNKDSSICTVVLDLGHLNLADPTKRNTLSAQKEILCLFGKQ